MTAEIGHNSMTPIEGVCADFDAIITKAHEVCEGAAATSQNEMLVIDAVLKDFKTYKTALGKAGKEQTAPMHKAWKDEVALVKTYTDDADRIQAVLVS